MLLIFDQLSCVKVRYYYDKCIACLSCVHGTSTMNIFTLVINAKMLHYRYYMGHTIGVVTSNK